MSGYSPGHLHPVFVSVRKVTKILSSSMIVAGILPSSLWFTGKSDLKDDILEYLRIFRQARAND